MPVQRLFVVLGNQLFPPHFLEPYRDATVFMKEDRGLCTYERHHQQKIVLFLSAMRRHRDALRQAGFDVLYHELEPDQHHPEQPGYEQALERSIDELGIQQVLHFEVEDKPMEARLRDLLKGLGVERKELVSPGFLCTRKRFASYLESAKRPFMAQFYKQERRRQDILVDDQGEPTGGRWSFDEDNRKKLPRGLEPPAPQAVARHPQVQAVVDLVAEQFADHPGCAAEFGWPSSREESLAWLESFLAERFSQFGPYEDALTTVSPTVYHSLLSPMLNLGLVTPQEVLERVLHFAREHAVPLQSVEGLVRQIIGWREFVRGIYRHFSEQQETSNHWGHERELSEHWYAGNTGIPPLDDTIEGALRRGWTHHIPRLMVAANLMTLCEIRPTTAHRWFMEMFVDSSEWVMGPNVYGMGLFSDGGVFATKPYICGSNYLLKMSNYRRGAWCDVVDGLYWRFIERHRRFLASQPRLALMPKALDRLSDERRERIFPAADAFLARCTR